MRRPRAVGRRPLALDRAAPRWHPGEFGSQVASFAVQAGDDTVLIDPLLPPDPEDVLRLIDEQLDGRLSILITVPYHVRSSEEIRQHFRKRAEITIWGHPACRKRLQDQAGFRDCEPGDELPAGVSAYAIGKPRRHEMPLLIPSHKALVFGDAVAEVDGELRVWSDRRVDEGVARFYRERFNPTLEPLLELDFERVLVTHGQPGDVGWAGGPRAGAPGRPLVPPEVDAASRLVRVSNHVLQSHRQSGFRSFWLAICASSVAAYPCRGNDPSSSGLHNPSPYPSPKGEAMHLSEPRAIWRPEIHLDLRVRPRAVALPGECQCCYRRG